MSASVDKSKVVELLYAAVDDLNQQLRKDQRLEKALEIRLVGEGGRLDSLGLLNLLVQTEQRIETVFGINVMLADDEAMSKDPSPFSTLGSLAEHVCHIVHNRLQEK
jgi:hypothetical protein